MYLQSSVGLLFLWSADSIRKGTPNGLEGAFGMDNPKYKDSDITYAFHATRCIYSPAPLFTSSSCKRPYPGRLGRNGGRQWVLLWENTLRSQKSVGIGFCCLRECQLMS